MGTSSGFSTRTYKRIVPWLGKVMKDGWRGLRLFLEVIGLLHERKEIDHSAQLSRFKLYYNEFRRLISANNSFLETLAELDQKRNSMDFVDRSYIKRKVVRAVADVHTMVESLNSISGNRYQELRNALDRITDRLTSIMEDSTLSIPFELVLDMSSIQGSHADLVGGKMAHLGEIRNSLGLPAPDGFAITTEAFRILLDEGGLRSWIQNEHLGLNSPEDISRVSMELREKIMDISIPKVLAESIISAYDRLSKRMGKRVSVAVRSSALGEDSELSFAGQFLTLLNVPEEGIIDAYLRVIASLYSPEAIQYRILHRIPGESAQMAVGVIPMTDSIASGVVFSRDPERPEPGMVLIQAVRGLGVTLVEGSASPEMIRVSLAGETPEIRRSISRQKVRLVVSSDRGLKEEGIPEEDEVLPCITDEEAKTLAKWAMELESHFGKPQDIEWAIDAERKLIILQSRPLRILTSPLREEGPLPDFPLLLKGGEVACPGVGIGLAVHMNEDGDFDSFPEGGILVARRSSPKFIHLMSRARAIVTDAGSTTGHMASLARELKVPALLNTGSATKVIPSGTLITVDATNGFVYLGEVHLLKERYSQIHDKSAMGPRPSNTQELQFLEKAMEMLAPLNLIDPSSKSFAPSQCATLHDLARYIHEKSYEEMFGMGEKLGDFRSASYQLDVFLPIDLYIIDLGGGLREEPKGRKVKPSQIASVPLNALLKGMLHEKIPRFGPRPMDIGGFLSVVMRHATTSPENERTFMDPCYALISESYLNYTARVGYHFSVVDTYCSATPNKNYISLLFRGGAADSLRRSRRAWAIAGILKKYGFSVQHNLDVVIARQSKASLEETVSQIEMLGRLLQFFRQMDAAMSDDETALLFQEAFLRGDYDMRIISRRGTSQDEVLS